MRKAMLSLFALTLLSGAVAGCATTPSSESSSLGSSSSSSTVAFDASKTIKPYTRDTTSGTRDGFFTKIGIEAAKTNDSLISTTVGTTISNGDMMTKIAADQFGIGYASLADLDGSVTTLKVNGVAATEATVKDGTYALQRDFNYVIPAAEDRSELKSALIASYIGYMNSAEGIAIIQDDGGILDDDALNNAEDWSDIIATASWATVLGLTAAGSSNASVKEETIHFVGSTSVEKISTALSSAWSAAFGVNAPAVDHNHTGSGDAAKKLADGSGDIGFASRAFTAAETDAHTDWTFAKICTDAISVIVNNDNNFIDDITIQQLRDIYVNPDKIADSATSQDAFGEDYSSESPITIWNQLA